MIDASVRDAWPVVLDRIRSFIGRRLPSQEVDDVLQDVLLKIHRHAPDLVDDERFGPWVYSIARNSIADHFRKRISPVDGLTADLPDRPNASDDTPPLLDCVAPFVGALTEPYRQAITLVELQGLTQQEAARQAGVSLSGMKSRVQRGRRQLRDMFETCCALSIDRRGKVFDAEPRITGAPCDCDSPSSAADASPDATRSGCD
jgi:RNA polymerase sigma-70 factor (ECF subfamily)